MNPIHLSIQEIQTRYESAVERLGDYEIQANSTLALQLDTALGTIAKSTAFRLIHPLLIKRYSRARMKYRTTPIKCVGVDVETVHTTGEPKLLGIYNVEPIGHYRAIVDPSLADLFDIVEGMTNNLSDVHIAVWGTLDIQIILRLFGPSENERLLISRGISARVVDGEFAANPPLQRKIGDSIFYIAHYIPGRSLKLGILDKKGYESTIWVFNLSQFFPGTIEQTAKGVGLYWKDFEKETHLIDWERFSFDTRYNKQVRDSNKQDAQIVQQLSHLLQEQFGETFGIYPSLLVSTGSLTDAAVAKMLDADDYKACAWDWLRHHVWDNSHESLKAEILLAEAFSAGYVDQFAIGYFPEVCTADIASAYPDKIRELPDFRECEIVYGEDAETLHKLLAKYDIETVVFRGKVTIPDTLKFHPITIKTYARENYRPIGTFHAAYTLDEKQFCESYGATFEDEQWAAFIIHNRKPSPLAIVSQRLGQLRDFLLKERDKHPKESDDYRFLDGQQYVTKVIDNSIYGKTVMTTEFVENFDGIPLITGYIAGDRFNLLMGVLITSRTRIQIARACMAIEANGGNPIMTMTDSIYWEGNGNELPSNVIQEIKTPGFFEPPQKITDFFILKTGQYEYKSGDKWSYKLRGLPVLFDELKSTEGFYRRLIKDANLPITLHPREVSIPLNTRRLISIGASSLDHLGLVSDQTMALKPFLLSSKQSIREVKNWPACIDGHLWLPPLTTKDENGASQAPLFFLNELAENRWDSVLYERTTKRRNSQVKRAHVIRDNKRLFAWSAMVKTHKAPLPGKAIDHTWEALESHFGVTRNDLFGR